MAKSSFVANPAKIKVIGLGGGGSNAVTRMVMEDIQGVEFIAMNTDAQALAICEAPVRVQLGEKLTRGLGVGGDHNLGQKAAEETRDELKELVSGADMVFVTAGMGGGTGTGAAPVVAETAKQSGALTIAVVTKPFAFEGSHRTQVADEGIARLLGKVDTLIIIPNDRLLTLCDQKTGVDSAFKMADDVLRHGVQAIAEVITVPGMINLDFADVKAIMKDAGPAWMSIGHGTGQNRAIDAAKEALASPLLDVSIEGSKAVLFNVVGGSNLTLFEVNQAAEVIKQAVDPDANIIFGVAHNPTMENDISITLVATGFSAKLSPDGSSDEEDELTTLLRGLKGSEEDLDVPSFLRRPIYSHRRQAITQSMKTMAKPPAPVRQTRPTKQTTLF
ncbi:MAG: cell division protein FtsZ [Chloroflexota bacterium]